MTIYRPFWQASRPGVSIAVRTAGDAAPAARLLRAAVQAIDPQLPVPIPRTMDEIVSQSIAQQRFQVLLVLGFAAVATLLASIGIYGVVAYAVAQRTSELGIRAALGATPRAIVAIVLGQGLRPVGVGLVAGLATTLGVGRVVSSLLYGVAPFDPLTMAGVVLTIGMVSLAAALLPARRAMRLDPVTALRQD
jgi:ABC-type antimicrobial peptide transport system permease subunit